MPEIQQPKIKVTEKDLKSVFTKVKLIVSSLLTLGSRYAKLQGEGQRQEVT